jgi:hypothetical protein
MSLLKHLDGYTDGEDIQEDRHKWIQRQIEKCDDKPYHLFRRGKEAKKEVASLAHGSKLHI